MASLNKAIVIGNVGNDPEVKFMASGDAVTTISVATTDEWKDKSSGEKRSVTEWHKVTFFRKLAEIVGEHVKKGQQVYVEGRIKTKKYTDKDGIERYVTNIEATEMKMLGRRDYDQAKESEPAKIDKSATVDDLSDDIPF